MVPDSEPATSAMRPSLFVESAAPQAVTGADAVICAVSNEKADVPHTGAIIWRLLPGDEMPVEARVCVAEGGLAVASELAACAEAVCVVPCAKVRRANRSYGFSSDSSGSGFHTFQLDPASAAGFTAADAGQDVPLSEWLHRAVALGFSEVWLQATDAGSTSELLALTYRAAPQVLCWISASGLSRGRFETICTMPGLAALVVLDRDLARFDPEVAVSRPEACSAPGIA